MGIFTEIAREKLMSSASDRDAIIKISNLCVCGGLGSAVRMVSARLAQPVPTPVTVWLNVKVGMKLSVNGHVYGISIIMFEY